MYKKEDFFEKKKNMSIFFNKDTRRRIFQSTLATLNMAEVTKDEKFEKRYETFRGIMEKYENIHGLLTEYWESLCFTCSAKNKVVMELLKMSPDIDDEDNKKSYDAFKEKLRETHNLANKMIMEGFCAYYKQRVLRPIQIILEQGPKIEEKIKRCRELQLDVDAYARKAQDARDALDKISKDDSRRRSKAEDLIRNRDKKLKGARAVMNEAKQEFYDDLSEIEMAFPKRMREQLVANLSLQVCMYEHSRDLLQPLTAHVPESGSELLLMSSFCSDGLNAFSRDAKRRRVSDSVRSVIPTPSLDDISRHLVAEQWREGGSVAVPFGLPVARESKKEGDVVMESKSFTTLDDFDNVMQSQRNKDTTTNHVVKHRTVTTSSRPPPKLPARDREPTPRRNRGGMRLNDNDAKTLARLSDETNRNNSIEDKKQMRKSNRGPPPPLPPVRGKNSVEKKSDEDPFSNMFGSESTTTTNTNASGNRTSLNFPSDEEDDDLLTPEDSDIEEEEEEEEENEKKQEKDEEEKEEEDFDITEEGIRIRLNHEKRKGKYVFDSISSLWYNTKTKYFFNENTKLYCKNPTDGPYFRYNREQKKLEQI